MEVKEKRKNTDPYLANLNEDPILSYVICHFISKQVKIGRAANCDIQLNGLNIISEHALIANEKGAVKLSPFQPGAKIKVNGKNLNEPKVLEHGDRILFGTSHMYVFINPQKQAPNEPKITWEMAQKEIAEATGYAVQKDAVLTKGSINFCFLFLFACHILTKKNCSI